MLAEVGVALLHDLGDGPGAIHGHAQDLEDRALARKAAILPVEARPRAEQVDDILRVAAVEDREARLQSDVPGRAPEDRVREGVEGPARDLLAARADERGSAAEHLLGRLAREGQEEDVTRIH